VNNPDLQVPNPHILHKTIFFMESAESNYIILLFMLDANWIIFPTNSRGMGH